ncbi:zinc ribbon domain-containing protein [Pigmentiphaga sp. YJ18]|uniref:zinc ribbon domain-containing protein n=1 Tax=unclassified Pigmentiphaga TaxID=2626614 RepID=UPI0013760362|nr:zinc ribbon domain-containing protein [Pigmentiphaga sp. H8]
MIVFIAIIAAICVGVFVFKARQRAKAREIAREKHGKQCPSCGKYVHPAAAICKHCYARLPASKT